LLQLTGKGKPFPLIKQQLQAFSKDAGSSIKQKYLGIERQIICMNFQREIMIHRLIVVAFLQDFLVS